MINAHVADQLVHGGPLILALGALRKWLNGPPMDSYAVHQNLINTNMGKNIIIFPIFLLMFLPPLAGGMRRVPLVWHRGLMGEKGA